MKTGEECLFRYLFKIYVCLVVGIDEDLGGGDTLVYVSRKVHRLNYEISF
jgi:hypothetical protein